MSAPPVQAEEIATPPPTPSDATFLSHYFEWSWFSDNLNRALSAFQQSHHEHYCVSCLETFWCSAHHETRKFEADRFFVDLVQCPSCKTSTVEVLEASGLPKVLEKMLYQTLFHTPASGHMPEAKMVSHQRTGACAALWSRYFVRMRACAPYLDFFMHLSHRIKESPLPVTVAQSDVEEWLRTIPCPDLSRVQGHFRQTSIRRFLQQMGIERCTKDVIPYIHTRLFGQAEKTKEAETDDSE